MSALDYQIFDCDTHCYETARRLHPVPAQGASTTGRSLRSATPPARRSSSPATASPPSTASRASGSITPTSRARSRRCSSRWPRATRTRPTSPSRCAPSSSNASPASRCSSSRASASASCFPPAWRWPPSTTSADTEALYANLLLVQPVVRRDVGLRPRGPPLRHRGAVAARPRQGGRADRLRARAGRPGGAAADRPGLRSLPRRPVLRPGVVPPQRGQGHRRLPHHAVLVLRRHLAGVGPRPGPGVVAHVGVAVEQRLRRAPDRGHAVGDHLRQRVRPPPGPHVPGRRARRRVGAALRPAHGQEPRHGPQRAVDRRQAHRATVGDLPPPRPRRSVPRGRHPLDRREPRPRRLDRDGLRLPPRRGPRRAGRLRQAPRPARRGHRRGGSCATTPRRCSPDDGGPGPAALLRRRAVPQAGPPLPRRATAHWTGGASARSPIEPKPTGSSSSGAPPWRPTGCSGSPGRRSTAAPA